MFVYLQMIDFPQDRTKFEKIYYAYKGLMFHVAYKILQNEADAEDAVHNAFVKIAEKISDISEPVCPKTQHFIVTIVENKAIDLYRSNQRKNSVKYLDEMEVNREAPEHFHGLAACMARLTPRYRQVIQLKYYHGYSNREIAKIMNITEANAIKLDQRAKKRLAVICEEEGVQC